MTTPLLDITRDVCPMTFVKVKMGLVKVAPGEKMKVRLKEDALKNVISSLKQEGHAVTGVSHENGIFLLEVTKGGLEPPRVSPPLHRGFHGEVSVLTEAKNGGFDEPGTYPEIREK